MGDDFLRLLLCRHVFACVVLRIHRNFAGSTHSTSNKGDNRNIPSSLPALPELDILENPTLQRYALDLAHQLDVRHHFVESGGEID